MDSNGAETVGGGGKRQRTEDDGGNVDTECKELLGGNVDTELLVLATKPLLGVDTDDNLEPNHGIMFPLARAQQCSLGTRWAYR